MSWGKVFSDAWNSASDTAKAAAKGAMESMDAAADLAVDIAKTTKQAATDFVDWGVDKAKDFGQATKRMATELADRGTDTARAIRDKAVDTYHAVKRDFSLSRASNAPVQDCPLAEQKLGDLDCPGLVQQKDKLAQAQAKAKLANAVYQEPGRQDLPQGWSRATDDDLRDLGLTDAKGRRLTEIPDSDFRADVFKGPDGKYVVAFKGTTFTSLEDWKNNVQQGTGNPAQYYTRAMEIADQVNANQPDNVEYVGHSLGGGLASAAAAMYDSPSTTFNAAGLNDQTLLRTGVVPSSDNTDAYYVEGDILSALQDNTFGLAAQGAGERIPLSPADAITWGDVKAGALAGAVLGPVFGAVAGAGTRGVRLHGMGSVEDALAKRMDQIDLLREHKGCN
ncbi:MAG: Mbeg1-like protein [Lamprobacter sp.]|uniref:Mbeg1-like protein n=1 Tax=Lamprobacter sp. TaxID=3100796 RepID=UPI002B25BA72|nr:Mbeg1-like protein [Lamprobacter sp.]MEA3643449.1 Mbeg1-like protein [Lamprobacter sp.]